MNRQNNRWLRSNPRIVPVIMSMKFPTAVMVMGVISNEGDFWGEESVAPMQPGLQPP